MRAVLWLSGAVLLGLALFEVTMQPSPSERTELLLIFLAMAVLAAAAAILLLRWATVSTSIRVTLVILALASFFIVAGALVVAANQMFLIAASSRTSNADIFTYLGIAAGGIGMVAGVIYWLNRVAHKRRFDSHSGLFQGLCQAHGLGRNDRKASRRTRRSNRWKASRRRRRYGRSTGRPRFALAADLRRHDRCRRSNLHRLDGR